jgi:non-ribosomal peptide synthetase component E (peptide arylation enzyme)
MYAHIVPGLLRPKRLEFSDVYLFPHRFPLQTYCNSHASALLDLEFKAGETIIVWLPESAEKHVVMMAAAKIGMKVVDVDLDVTELSAVRSFLAETKPKAIYFKPQHEDADYLLLLRKAIPEFFECTYRHWPALFGPIGHHI